MVSTRRNHPTAVETTSDRTSSTHRHVGDHAEKEGVDGQRPPDHGSARVLVGTSTTNPLVGNHDTNDKDLEWATAVDSSRPVGTSGLDAATTNSSSASDSSSVVTMETTEAADVPNDETGTSTNIATELPSSMIVVSNHNSDNSSQTVTTTNRTRSSRSKKARPHKRGGNNSRRVKASTSSSSSRPAGSKSRSSQQQTNLTKSRSNSSHMASSATANEGSTAAVATVSAPKTSSPSKQSPQPSPLHPDGGVLTTRHGEPVTKIVMHTGILYINVATREAEFVRTK